MYGLHVHARVTCLTQWYTMFLWLQKEYEVKRQRKLLEQELEAMDSSSEAGGQSSTALFAIEDCKFVVTHAPLHFSSLFHGSIPSFSIRHVKCNVEKLGVSLQTKRLCIHANSKYGYPN